jgi:release factor glutamine methyltransferase
MAYIHRPYLVCAEEKRRQIMSYQSPLLEHLRATDYDEVYVPSEDTFLFEDVLRRELTERYGGGALDGSGRQEPVMCLEVGPGSGYLSTVMAKMLPRSYVVAVDINNKACDLTRRTCDRNGVGRRSDVVRGDVAECFMGSGAKFDVIVFNPPYVPSEESELNQDDITASYAGGERGRVVTDRSLKTICPCLSERGSFYLLLIAQNDVEEFRTFAQREFCLASEVVGERKSGWEHQTILRCIRQATGR